MQDMFPVTTATKEVNSGINFSVQKENLINENLNIINYKNSLIFFKHYK
jgi:hypothetical protein